MRSRFQSGFSSSDRLLLDSLHRKLFGKDITKTGCSDCYRDAYVIIVNHLKKTKTMPKTPNYVLKGGALIHPFGTSKFYTNPISDEVAEEHLSNFPDEINKYAHYPDDWEARAAAFAKRKVAEIEAKKTHEEVEKVTPAADNSEEIENLKVQLTEAQEAAAKAELLRTEAENKVRELEEENTNLEKRIEELNAKTGNQTASDGEGVESEDVALLRMELETAKADLDAANEEIATLKTDNRALKAANTRLKNNGAKDTE